MRDRSKSLQDRAEGMAQEILEEQPIDPSGQFVDGYLTAAIRYNHEDLSSQDQNTLYSVAYMRVIELNSQRKKQAK